MKTSREQFEKWAKTTNSDLERYKTGVNKGDFKNPVMRKMWLAWQASRQCIEIDNDCQITITNNTGQQTSLRDVVGVEVV